MGRLPRLTKPFGGNFGLLLCVLFLFIATSPIIVDGRFGNVLLTLIGTLVLAGSVYAANPSRKSLTIAITLSVIDLATGWMASALSSPTLVGLQLILWLTTLLYAAAVILSHILRNRKVTAETLKAALCSYIFLGLIWVFIHGIIDFISPSQYHFQRVGETIWGNYSSRRAEFLNLFILSYSTLTASGVAGLEPHGAFARIAICLEAMTGQFFLAVLISRLVGLQITQEIDASAPQGE